MGDPVLKISEGRPIAICWDWRNCSAAGRGYRDMGGMRRDKGDGGRVSPPGWCVVVGSACNCQLCCIVDSTRRLGLALLALKKMLLVSVTRFSYLQMDGDHVSMHDHQPLYYLYSGSSANRVTAL
jgi:hypothetical protein